jgi:hypothetical protein
MGPRASLEAVEKIKDLALPGIDPAYSLLQCRLSYLNSTQITSYSINMINFIFVECILLRYLYVYFPQSQLIICISFILSVHYMFRTLRAIF